MTRTAQSTVSPKVAVVVPAHRPSHELHRCLAALRHCDPAPAELAVVVDGADQAVVAAARAVTDQVVELQRAGGPARARNAGVAATTSEVVYFVDSDVEVRPDAVGRVQAYLGAHPAVDALIGSYDDQPPAPGVVSQYKNLLNHHMHQTASREATTFWGACGAIRRAAFLAVGGFDETYTRPCVEDIELGYRLRAAGRRIHVVKDLQVTHLKRWTARSMILADTVDRAIPWSELIVSREGLTDDLNISRSQRLKVVTAGVAAVTTTLAVSGAARGRRSRPSERCAVMALGSLALLDARLLRFFARRRGWSFAVVAAGWHWLSYLYSGAVFGLVVARQLTRRVIERGRPPPAPGTGR